MNRGVNIYLSLMISLCVHITLLMLPVNTITIKQTSFNEELIFTLGDVNSSINMPEVKENIKKNLMTKTAEIPPSLQESKVEKLIEKEEAVKQQEELKEMVDTNPKLKETESKPIEYVPVKATIQSTNGNQEHKLGLIGSKNQNTAELKEVNFGAPFGPKFLHREVPTYPLMAKKLGKEGKVLLRLTIDEHGNLKNVEVLEKADYGFTESAIEAIKKSTFLPAIENGVPVASRALLSIKFELRSR
mgnify:CR=1 FL=1